MDIMLREELSKIYSAVPEGDCSGCGRCCHESVGASFAEAEVIYQDIKAMPAEKRKQIIDRIMDYYFDVYQVRRKCPFLSPENRCEIYASRPLNCRIYGHWSRQEYENNLDRLKCSNDKISQVLIEKYGYKVKQDYLDFSIGFCTDFRGRLLSRGERNELYDSLIVLDSKMFVRKGLRLAYEDKGIVEHIVDRLLSKERIFEIKMRGELSPEMRKRLKNIAGLRIGAV